MNRYRRVPGTGPLKATATTRCQKCLQRGHYSYECKSSLQERPYASRPSRTQQFSNPKLAPKLTSVKLDEGGAESKAGKGSNGLANGSHPSPPPRPPQQQHHQQPLPTGKAGVKRSSSPSSATSVSTISTNRSPSPEQSGRGARDVRSASASLSRSRSRARSRSRSRSRARGGERGRKRRHASHSSASASRSPSVRHRSPSHRKNRRRRFDSPAMRGRPVPRRGSHRSPSRSPSLDQRRRRRSDASPMSPTSASQRMGVPQSSGFVANGRPRAKPRSLSPYSRRLALTQAMNMGR